MYCGIEAVKEKGIEYLEYDVHFQYCVYVRAARASVYCSDRIKEARTSENATKTKHNERRKEVGKEPIMKL